MSQDKNGKEKELSAVEVFPSTSSSSGHPTSEKSDEKQKYKQIREKLFSRFIPYYGDKNAYEDEEGYEATDPKKPDRRWKNRVLESWTSQVDDQRDVTLECWNDTDNMDVFEKMTLPKLIDKERYTKDEYERWLANYKDYSSWGIEHELGEPEVEENLIEVDSDEDENNEDDFFEDFANLEEF